VQADIGWALRDENVQELLRNGISVLSSVPNWTGSHSELDDPILRKQPLEGLIPIDCSDCRAARSCRDSQLVAGR
jgi:hypothetical protein